jgi:YVTN family beta-propeller protein
MFVIDGNTNSVVAEALFGSGSVEGMVWNSFRNKVYVSSYRDHSVYVMDGTTDRIVARVAVYGQPMGLCYNSANDKVYATSDYDSIVSVIDCRSDTVVATVELPDNGGDLAYNSVMNRVYSIGSSLAVIDGGADALITTLALPDYSDRLCFIPPHNKLYASSNSSSFIYVVDCAGDSLVKTLETSASPTFISYDIGNDRVYAATPENGRLEIYDPGTDSLLRYVPIGYWMPPALDNGRTGDDNRVYCASGQSNAVMVISGTANETIRTIQVGEDPIALAWNPAHSWMYVANYFGSSISVLRDTLVVGLEEGQLQAASRKLQASVVRGVLFLPEAPSQKLQATSLLDISGRKVLDLHPGTNDVRHLAPGVYFVRREGEGAMLKTTVVR